MYRWVFLRCLQNAPRRTSISPGAAYVVAQPLKYSSVRASNRNFKSFQLRPERLKSLLLDRLTHAIRLRVQVANNTVLEYLDTENRKPVH